MEGTEGLIVVLVLSAAIIGVIALVSASRRQTANKRGEALAKMEAELHAFVARVEQGFTPISTNLVLHEEEYGILEEGSTLFETRAYRVYGGGGTRVKGVYIGGGVSESQQRLRQIDTGTLTLTTKRLVFDGTHENRSIRLSDLLSANPWADAIEVSSQRRAKSQIFRVNNPLIWATIVKSVAEGKFTVRLKADERAPTPRNQAASGPMHLGDFEGNEEEVVGESHYQANLARLAELHPPDGARLRQVVATLVHEDDNPVDPLAVRVDIVGLTVGYLTRASARQYRQWLAASGHAGRTCTCAARITGGWDRKEGGRAHFGVELDVPSFYGPVPDSKP